MCGDERRILERLTPAERELFAAIGGTLPALGPAGGDDSAADWYRHDRRAHLRPDAKVESRRRSREAARAQKRKRLVKRFAKFRPAVRHETRPRRAHQVRKIVRFHLGQPVVVRPGAPSRFAGLAGVIVREPRQPRRVMVRFEGRSGEEQVPTEWLRAVPQKRSAA